MQSIFRIAFIPVEKVLGIEENRLSETFKIANRFGDHLEIRIEAHPQGVAYMEVPALADNGDTFRVCVEEGFHDGIGPGFGIGLHRAGEGHDAGSF